MASVIDMLNAGLRSGAAAAFMTAMRYAAVRDAPGFDEAWREVDFIPGWMPETTAAVHWGVIAELKPKCVVEIGTYQGRSAALIGLALRQHSDGGHLVTIDPHTGGWRMNLSLGETPPSTAPFAKAHLAALDLLPKTVEVRVARSEEVAPKWHEPIDLAYIDGWHTYDAARGDGMAWGTHLSERGVVVFDDAGSYDDVRAGARDAATELGLHWYGLVLGQAWAGRSPEPPATLKRLLRYPRFIRK